MSSIRSLPVRAPRARRRAASAMGALTAVTLLLAGAPARAQSTADKAAAEGLFDQGRSAMQQRDFNKACGLLERSQHIDPGVGTLLYLAECYEKSGRTASAWATFREAGDAADAAHSPARAKTARDRALRLEPLLSRLTISVDPETVDRIGLVIERRGVAIAPAMFNVPVPVDPGTYAIVAQAPGFETWSQNVEVPERSGAATVAVPALTRLPEGKGGIPIAAVPSAAIGSPSAGPTSGPAALGASSPPALDPSSPGSTQRALSYVVGGLGVVGVGVGSYFGVRAITKSHSVKDQASTSCTADYVCTDASVASDQDAARSAARTSNIAFAVGGAALLGGALLYFTAPSRSANTGYWGARMTLGGVLVEGRFQ